MVFLHVLKWCDGGFDAFISCLWKASYELWSASYELWLLYDELWLLYDGLWLLYNGLPLLYCELPLLYCELPLLYNRLPLLYNELPLTFGSVFYAILLVKIFKCLIVWRVSEWWFLSMDGLLKSVRK